VVIETNLSADQGRALERKIQEALRSDKRARCYQKYDPEVRDSPYRGSIGGSQNYKGNNYLIYMTWK
jgi:hypothetical protein